jgi:ATP-dependent DNA helicase RecQ
MAILPTNAGKTMIGWALMALLFIIINGADIDNNLPTSVTPFCPVIIYFSPLIRLMEEQVAEFNSYHHNFLPAARCSADQPSEILTRIKQGLVSVLYMSPEAALGAFFFIFKAAEYAGRIIAFFYDEAHLVLEWGDDFRKDFQNLLRVRSVQGFKAPWIAGSATVTPSMQPKIIEHLGLTEPLVLQRPINRPEIYLSIMEYDSQDWKWMFEDLIDELIQQVRFFFRVSVVFILLRAGTLNFT